MNNVTCRGIAVLSVAVAVVSVAAAFSLSARNRRAEEETAGLIDRIARLEADLSLAQARTESALSAEGATGNPTAFRRIRPAAQTNAAADNAAAEEETNQPPRRRESFEERMARLKEEDPEAYAEMIQRREERRQRMQYSFAERTATFMDLDTSRMTDDERATHEELVEKMARIWELTSQLDDPEAAPDRETMRELFSEMRDARPLMQEERTVMFRQLGMDLGYEGEEAAAFADCVEEIIESTTLSMPRGGGRRGGRDR